MNKDGKEQTQTTRATEETSNIQPDRGSDRGTQKNSRDNGSITIRTDRADRERTNPHIRKTLAGGILDQLMKQAEEQRQNAIECIDWYEEEKTRAELKLEELQQLAKQLAEETTE